MSGWPGRDARLEQVWTSQGYATRFGLALDPSDIGYGHSSQQVASVRASADLLTAYLRAVHDQTVAYVAGHPRRSDGQRGQ